jgi:hypothetical protein
VLASMLNKNVGFWPFLFFTVSIASSNWCTSLLSVCTLFFYETVHAPSSLDAVAPTGLQVYKVMGWPLMVGNLIGKKQNYAVTDWNKKSVKTWMCQWRNCSLQNIIHVIKSCTAECRNMYWWMSFSLGGILSIIISLYHSRQKFS